MSALVGVVAWCASVAVPCQAYFDRMAVSARAIAMGGAFVSVVDDATSVVHNPAGLALVNRFGAYATYHKPFGLDALDDGFFSGAWRDPRLSAGFGVFHRALAGSYSETLVTLALARDVVRTAEDASLSVGLNVGAARVDAADRFDASEVAVTLGGGITLRPFATVGLAYYVSNIGEPRLELISGSGQSMRRTHSLGFSYRWDASVLLSMERSGADDVWENRGGVEVDMGPYLTLRAGVRGRHAAGGFGVSVGGVVVDVGAVSHDILGASYIVSVGYAPPREGPFGTRGAR